jgi:hypothetical protein
MKSIEVHRYEIVHTSPVTGDLYVLCVLPNDGKFQNGDHVEIRILKKQGDEST